MENSTEKINSEQKAELTSKKARKKAFTLRIEENIIDRLDELTQKSSKAAVARNFLNLSHYMTVNPDLSIEMPDGTQSLVIPKTVFELMSRNLNYDKQIIIGDELGRIINTNFAIRQYKTLKEKVLYIQSIGLIDYEIIERYERYYYGIVAKDWALPMLQAFLYRIIVNRTFPSEWNVEEFKDYMGPDKRRPPGPKRKIVEEYMKIFGDHHENYDENERYYVFDILLNNQQ